jgi:hypothetical protein
MKCKNEENVCTVKLFSDIAEERYRAYISDYVIKEIKLAEQGIYNKNMNIIKKKHKINILPTNDEIRRLADLYVHEKAVPKKFRTDALHIATATYYKMDMIISMNLEHIVKHNNIYHRTH